MAKTKLTKRSGTRKCPMCSELLQGDNAFSAHVIQCAMKEYACEFCDFTSQKECNVKRHVKRAHAGLTETPMPLGQTHGTGSEETHDTASEDKTADTAKDNASVSSESDSESEEWMSQDPGDLLHTESTEGITACCSGKGNVKETVTEPESDVMVGRVFRKKTSPSLPGKRPSSDSANNLLESIVNVVKKTKVDVGTQTEFFREISVKTVRKFRDGSVDVKETTTEKKILY